MYGKSLVWIVLFSSAVIHFVRNPVILSFVVFLYVLNSLFDPIVYKELKVVIKLKCVFIELLFEINCKISKYSSLDIFVKVSINNLSQISNVFKIKILPKNFETPPIGM